MCRVLPHLEEGHDLDRVSLEVDEFGLTSIDQDVVRYILTAWHASGNYL